MSIFIVMACRSKYSVFTFNIQLEAIYSYTRITAAVELESKSNFPLVKSQPSFWSFLGKIVTDGGY